MQGSQDIAVHVGTLHFTGQGGDRGVRGRHPPGRRVRVNDPYLGGTHFNDVRIIRPIFADGEVIAYAQSNGHWADVGGSVPGSFDVSAKEHFGEGLRIPPVRIWDKGALPATTSSRMIVSNTRAPERHRGRPATRRSRRRASPSARSSGSSTSTARDTVVDRVRRGAGLRRAPHPHADRRAARRHVGDRGLPRLRPDARRGPDPDQGQADDRGRPDPLRPVRLAPGGRRPSSTPASARAFSGVVAGTKTFFPDIPLNSGFYRAVTVDLGPEGTVVNAAWPIAVTGFCSGPYEKIMNAIFELWSQVMPERAMACCFNLEYLLVGGRDARSEDRPFFMWYDWMVGGWGGRNGRTARTARRRSSASGSRSSRSRARSASRPVAHDAATRSSPTPAGPGSYRGGCGVEKGGTLTQAERTVDVLLLRPRALDHVGHRGRPAVDPARRLAQPRDRRRALPRRDLLQRAGRARATSFTRPSAGGGGYGDPLERDPSAVLRGRRRRLRHRSSGRARTTASWSSEVDAELSRVRASTPTATEARARADPRASARRLARRGPRGRSRARYRAGELDVLDLVRQLRRHPRLGHRRAAAEDDASSSARCCSAAPAAHWATVAA